MNEKEKEIRLQRNRGSRFKSRRSQENLQSKREKSTIEESPNPNNTIKYFSMFTGVGGFELGLERTNNNQQSDFGKESKSEESKTRRKWDSDKQGTQLCSSTKSTFRCIGFSETDKYCNELLKNKFPNIKNYGDTRKIIPKELQDFNLLVGGFPCQAFSIAGKRRGFEDTRGTLFHEIVRVLEVKRPEYLLLENVKGLLSHDKGRTFAIILASLSRLGYVIQWMVLNSKFFGVPQNRERVFIIGSLRGEPIPEVLPLGETKQEDNSRFSREEESSPARQSLQPRERYSKSSSRNSWFNTTSNEDIHPSITEAIGRQGSSREYRKSLEKINRIQFDVSGKGYNSQQDRIYFTDGVMATLPFANPDDKLNIAIPILTPDREKKRQHGRRFKEDGEPSFTLTGQDIHGVAIMDLYNKKEHTDRSPTLTEPHHNTLRVREGMKIRRLTPIECERLQGFPDNWTEGFSDTQRYKMMGNAVTVNVVQAIAEKLI